MGDHGVRRVKWLSEDALLLSDTFHTRRGSVKKTKLVRLTPARMQWTSTHVTGRNKYSQFLYQITPEGQGGSRLEFTGLHIEYTRERMSPELTDSLTKRILSEDSSTWKVLAREMEKDVSKRQRDP